MTPFEAAGYTEVTKFRVLRDQGDIKKGDIVGLYEDDGSDYPFFKAEDGQYFCMYLPNNAPEGFNEQLEVYGRGK